MPQILFAFEFECERPNDLCTAKSPFGCSEIFTSFFIKTAELQFSQTFKDNFFYIFECELLNANSSDLCMAIHIQTQMQTETEGYRTDL